MFLEGNIPLFPARFDMNSWEQEQMQEREARLMKSFFPQTAAKVQSLVEKECDRLEYDGSMLYDEYPDKFMMEEDRKRSREWRSSGTDGKDNGNGRTDPGSFFS